MFLPFLLNEQKYSIVRYRCNRKGFNMKPNGHSRSVPERQKERNEIVQYRPQLKHYAVSLCKNSALADDLTQQTILLGLKFLHTFTEGSNMKAWLFTILRNEYFTHLRKKKREKEWSPKLENSIQYSTGFKANEAESTYDFRHLVLLLACLPPKQMDAVTAVGYLGLSYEDSALRLGCQVGTVKSRVSRARDDLASMMNGAVITRVKLSKLKTATKGFHPNHPYFPIAKAYEELFAACDDVDTKLDGSVSVKATKSEELWEDLVASGALDNPEEDLPEFLEDYSTT